MNPKVNDLISALSDWENVPNTERQARENLKQLLADLSRRPVPVRHRCDWWASVEHKRLTRKDQLRAEP